MQAAVIVAHTAIGPQEAFIHDKVHALADEGFCAFALDLFGAGECVFGEQKDQYNAQLKQHRPLIADRAAAALRTVCALDGVDAARVAAVGYCLGGKCVLDLARSGAALQGVVSVHGILDNYVPAGPTPVQPEVLCFHGMRDPFVSREMLLGFVDEMEERNARYELRLLGSGVMHAFTRAEKVAAADLNAGLFYDERSASMSWHDTVTFLHRVLA